MTQAQYRDATFSMVVILHAFLLGLLAMYFFKRDVLTKPGWFVPAYAWVLFFITLSTAGLFIAGWAGASDTATI